MASQIPHILIIDGDKQQVDLSIDLIQDVGKAKIQVTNSTDTAVELVSKHNFQLLIVDCTKDTNDGQLVIERVRRASPNTSVILTTATPNIEEAVKLMRLGADDYFKKPYNPETFKLAVQRCLDRRQLLSQDKSFNGLMHLINACQIISGSLEEEKIVETAVNYIKREVAPKGLALYQVRDQKRNRLPTSSDVDPDVVEVFVEGSNHLQMAIKENVIAKVVPKSGATPEIAIFQIHGVASAHIFVICVNPTWKTPRDSFDTWFRFLHSQIRLSGKNIQNFRGVRNLLYLDEPTGLYNTRYLQVCMDNLFEKFHKNKKEFFSVMFIDVDKFKGINDRFGHLIGTKLLLEMGKLITECIKPDDIAIRYGGDEFIIILRKTKTGEALEIAEKIRASVEKTRFMYKEGLNVRLTVSIGIANCPEHASNKREIIRAADEAMYVVKKTSRNKVYITDKKAAA